ncbi:melanocyte-stimulating hormone receptor-like [Actinia tenebrosa]|uniref:Melanocyte-stimulating hormone receptor-like n=1 Tax=Actinia tenebrosa TaxID=6105 RepID=A0A6P8HI27_ACTTE|nr:melanocyte-stimulating hormone receptor-like [Actinia tenebrosa]
MEALNNTSLAENGTGMVPTGQPHMPPPFDIGTAMLANGIFLAIMSPTTIILNSLLLFAIFKDPFKTFQSPSTYFLIGLTVTDLVSGLVVEPVVMTCYFMTYSQHPSTGDCMIVLTDHIGLLSAASINSSFLIVLSFTVVQYLAVSWPLKYKNIVNVRRTITCIIGIWIYTILFELLQKIGVPKTVIENTDLILHTTISFIVMVVFYILLQRSFHKKMKLGFVLRAESTIQSTSASIQADGNRRSPRNTPTNKQIDIEKKFIRVNLLLIALLFFCSIPNAIMWYILLVEPQYRNSTDFFIARIIMDNTLWVKFLLDPLIYAWRLPKYRRALKKSFQSH